MLYYFAIFENKVSISNKKQFRSCFGTKVYDFFWKKRSIILFDKKVPNFSRKIFSDLFSGKKLPIFSRKKFPIFYREKSSQFQKKSF
jgi:dihydroorotase